MKLLIVFLFSFSLCGAALQKPDWWNHATIYDIFIWSFKDSNDDGIGDLKGIVLKLDYLKDLGVDALKLSPIFSSPHEISNSYAVDNFYEIHKTLGNMKDFEELANNANSKGIKIILDINLNHCHESHEWFQKSIQRAPPYTDFFIWSDGEIDESNGLQKPPNNWRNLDGKSSWKWHNERKQFYYNYYNYISPHFNMGNKDLERELIKVLYFWMKKGISGFNFVDLKTYLYGIYRSDFYKDFLERIHLWFDIYNKRKPRNKQLFMTYVDQNDIRTHESSIATLTSSIFHLVTTNKMNDFNLQSSAPVAFFRDEITPLFESSLGSKLEWLLESPNHNRMANRNNKELAQLLLIIQAFVPGVMRIYYGAEIGMSENFGPSKKCVAIEWNHSNNKTLPMQWDNSFNAGFSNSNCLLQSPNTDYSVVNVENQRNKPASAYNLVQDLLSLRKEDSLTYGSINLKILNNMVLLIHRSFDDENIYAIINFNNISEEFSLEHVDNRISLTKNLPILFATTNAGYKKKDEINPKDQLQIRPMSSVVLRYINEPDDGSIIAEY